jgi:hypothetical protein
MRVEAFDETVVDAFLNGHGARRIAPKLARYLSLVGRVRGGSQLSL